MPTGARRFCVGKSTVFLTIAMMLLISAGKPKPKPKDPPPPPTPGPELPADLNSASLRVHAIDVIYEFDLSPEQLKAMRTAAEGAATDRKRTAAPANEKLAAAFADFNRALLTHQEDQEIAKLRNSLAELVSDDDSHIDDEVEATDTATTHSSPFCQKLGAGQLAAYLAAHADQISEPAEMIVALLAELHEETETVADPDTRIHQTSADVGRLVAGSDKKLSDPIAAKVTDWIKANRELTDEQLVSKHAELIASAKKMLGDVPPMDILSHWMDNEVAVVLSNPQLPQAIEAVLAAREEKQ